MVQPSRDPSPAPIAGLERYLIDDHVGILHALDREPPGAGMPQFVQYTALLCETRALARRPCMPRVVAASADPARARAYALRRAVSSYCAAFCEPDRLRFGASVELDDDHVAPGELTGFDDEQLGRPGFPWLPFDRDTPVRWAEAEDLLTGETVLVPSAMVYVPYYPARGSGEAPVLQPTVCGLACEMTRERAAASALLDVIRDDALAIAWQTRASPPQILVETLSDANYELVLRFERTRVAVTLLDLTPDTGVPVVLAVLIGDGPEAPCLVGASGAALDPEEAVRRALENLAHAHRCSDEFERRHASWPATTGMAVATAAEHLLFWRDAENIPHGRFLLASRRRVEFDELAAPVAGDDAADLDVLVERVHTAGHRALVADLTTPDMRGLGLHVVRAIIPGFHPLLLGAGMQPRVGTRLRRAGSPGPGTTFDAPHPFAANGFYHE